MARAPSTPGPQVTAVITETTAERTATSVASTPSRLVPLMTWGSRFTSWRLCASTMAVVLSGGISDIKAKRDYSKPKNLVVSRRCICFLVLIINKRRRLAHETKYRKRKDLSPKNYM